MLGLIAILNLVQLNSQEEKTVADCWSLADNRVVGYESDIHLGLT